MVTTVAPTMPVLAASSIPTSVTEMPRPPRRLPNSAAMVSSRFSATLERSSITPMKTNSGTAIRVSLVMMPNRRLGSASRKAPSNMPRNPPSQAKISAVPAREKATGYPRSRTTQTVINSRRAITSGVIGALPVFVRAEDRIEAAGNEWPVTLPEVAVVRA